MRKHKFAFAAILMAALMILGACGDSPSAPPPPSPPPGPTPPPPSTSSSVDRVTNGGSGTFEVPDGTELPVAAWDACNGSNEPAFLVVRAYKDQGGQKKMLQSIDWFLGTNVSLGSRTVRVNPGECVALSNPSTTSLEEGMSHGLRALIVTLQNPNDAHSYRIKDTLLQEDFENANTRIDWI